MSQPGSPTTAELALQADRTGTVPPGWCWCPVCVCFYADRSECPDGHAVRLPEAPTAPAPPSGGEG